MASLLSTRHTTARSIQEEPALSNTWRIARRDTDLYPATLRHRTYTDSNNIDMQVSDFCTQLSFDVLTRHLEKGHSTGPLSKVPRTLHHWLRVLRSWDLGDPPDRQPSCVAQWRTHRSFLVSHMDMNRTALRRALPG
jgi:hypothetical protein